jgi:hypothetical protein
MHKALTLVASLAVSSAVFGATTTAVCRDPVGTLFGQQGRPDSNRPVDEADDMKGGSVTIIMDPKTMEAQIVTQGPGGEKPVTKVAVPVVVTDKQISFLVTYPNAVSLYSLFGQPSVLLMSEHMDGLTADSGGNATGKSMMAKCEISVE